MRIAFPNLGFCDSIFQLIRGFLEGIAFAFINSMKPIINFVLRSAIITLNQDMVVFKEFMTVEQIQSFLKNISRKNDKR